MRRMTRPSSFTAADSYQSIRTLKHPLQHNDDIATPTSLVGVDGDLSRLAPPVPRFWETVQSFNIRQQLPRTRFMAWDFDQSIANMEPFHHSAFRGATVKLIQTVDRTFSVENPRFGDFWKLARRGFGIQEMDTVKVFTKAIACTWPNIARGLLERYALSLAGDQRERILGSLTARDRLDPNERFLQEEDYQAVVARVRAAFKRDKDGVVAELLRHESYTIREVPGAVDLIRRGKSEGLLVGLATGSPSSVVQPILKRMGILDLFDAAVYNDDAMIESDTQRKPYPFPYQELTRRLSEVAGQTLSTSEGIAFEDSLTGIRSAHGAGMPVIVRAPSLPWLFKKLLAPAGEFDDKPLFMGRWERLNRDKRARLVSELTSQSGTGLDKIYLLLQDVTEPSLRMRLERANRQHLSWDSVRVR